MGHLIERVNDNRAFDGTHEQQYRAILEELNAIKLAHGLTADDDFYLSDAPKEYFKTSDRWSATHDRLLHDTFIEFGLGELASLWSSNQIEYDRLRENGRSHFHESENEVRAIAQLVLTYEMEASHCEAADCHYAACVMLGAASEARLLLACLRNPASAEMAVDALKLRVDAAKAFPASPKRWTLDQLVSVAAEAGWLPYREDNEFYYDVTPWLNRLRGARNLLHAGRHIRDRPHLLLEAEQVRDAKAAYALLRSCLDEVDARAV